MKKEDLLKFYAQYKLFIFPLVVGISSLILIVFVILPQTIKLVTNQGAEEELFNKSQFLEVKAQDLDNLDQEDLSRKVQYVLGVYPADKDFGNIVGIIQSVTSGAGFNIVALNIGDQNAQNYIITLQVSGPRTLLPLLLSTVEKAPRLIRLDSLEISSTSGSQGIEASLGLNILYSPAPTTFGTVDSPLPTLSSEDEELLTTLASQNPISEGVEEVVDSGPRGKANPFE